MAIQTRGRFLRFDRKAPTIFLAVVAVLTAIATAAPPKATSSPAPSEPILDRKGCLSCHRFAGRGTKGSDLAFASGGEWTESGFASSLWNHGPRMWERAQKEKRELPTLSRTDAEEALRDPGGKASLHEGSGGASVRGEEGLSLAPLHRLPRRGGLDVGGRARCCWAGREPAGAHLGPLAEPSEDDGRLEDGGALASPVGRRHARPARLSRGAEEGEVARGLPAVRTSRPESRRPPASGGGAPPPPAGTRPLALRAEASRLAAGDAVRLRVVAERSEAVVRGERLLRLVLRSGGILGHGAFLRAPTGAPGGFRPVERYGPLGGSPMIRLCHGPIGAEER